MIALEEIDRSKLARAVSYGSDTAGSARHAHYEKWNPDEGHDYVIRCVYDCAQNRFEV